MHLSHVDHCGVMGVDVQLILASIELHQPPATKVQSPAKSHLLKHFLVCSLISDALEFFDERHGS